MTAALALPTRSGVRALLAAADAVKARIDEAAFAPPITTSGHCPCGSVFEIRRTELVATDDEKYAAAQALADCLGRSDVEFVELLVSTVLETIDAHREKAGRDALDDWRTEHEYCRSDW